ncbi:MAG: hypothetical protein GY754_14490 [bacterium]|nr:hypothetical protein [bacterium]
MEKNRTFFLLPVVLIISIVNVVIAISVVKINNTANSNRELLQQVYKLQKARVLGQVLAGKSSEALSNTSNDLKESNTGNLADMPGVESVLRSEIRELLKDELQDVIADLQNDSKPEPERVKRQRAQAYEKSQELVNNAIANGRWTEADVNQIRPVLSKLSKKQQEEIYKKLFPAINRGEIKLEARDIF